jgi:hypothetical protein
MTLQDWKEKPSVTLSADLEEALEHPAITLTSFKDKNFILTDESLQKEVGYAQTDDGIWQVSCFCQMPGVTVGMIDWWFWWHPKADIRYQLWYPEMHKNIHYRKSDEPYFRQKTMPDFQDNIQYPTETIGSSTMECVLKFISPEEDGFNADLMKENHAAVIVCAHVGMMKGLVMHTEMTHICFQRENGLFMVNRFWMGQLIRSERMRRKMITRETARGMCEHCLIEYRNMAERLPELYKEYGPGDKEC